MPLSYGRGEEYVYYEFRGQRERKSVLEAVQPKRPLETTILRLKLQYFGHVMRAKGLMSLERDIMLGLAGHRRQGKPRMRWLDSIKEATGLRLEVFKEIVQDRKKKVAHAGGRKDTE